MAPRSTPIAAAARGLALAAVTLGAVACATPTPPVEPEQRALYENALDLWIERYVRLQVVSHRIRLAGADLCGTDLSPVFGAALIRVRDLPDPLRPIAYERFGEADRLHVVSVVPDSAAARAGVEPGDQIVGLEGGSVLGTREIYAPRVAENRETLDLNLVRGDSRLELPIDIEWGCRYRAELIASRQFNAFADGDRIVFLSGAMSFMESDAEVALIAGHEIGHNIQFNTLGTRSGGLTGEARADYIGVYLARRAGYELGTGDFALTAIARASPGRLSEASATSHPSGPSRELAYQRALAEVNQKLADGLPLFPEGF